MGTTLVLLDLGAALSVDLNVEVRGQTVEELRDVRRGLRLRGPGFTGAVLTSAVDTVVEVVVSQADISVNYTDGATVNANILGTVEVSDGGAVLQVSNDRGTVGAPMYVAGLTYSDAPATAVNNLAPVPVTDAGAALLAANVTRKAARFCNVGDDPVAIGGAGLTWARRVLVLLPGDVWVEERGANVAWSAITEAGKTASVTVQEVMA